MSILFIISQLFALSRKGLTYSPIGDSHEILHRPLATAQIYHGVSSEDIKYFRQHSSDIYSFWAEYIVICLLSLNIPDCISPYHVYQCRDIYILLFHLLRVKIAISLKCTESRKVPKSNYFHPFSYCINILVMGLVV